MESVIRNSIYELIFFWKERCFSHLFNFCLFVSQAFTHLGLTLTPQTSMEQTTKETSSVEYELRQRILAIEQENAEIARKIKQVSSCTDETGCSLIEKYETA